jgi:hypothetical protein
VRKLKQSGNEFVKIDSRHQIMGTLLSKGFRFLECYRELAFGSRKNTPEWAVDYCSDRPIVMAQVRSEITALGKLIQDAAPKCSMEIGTNYGGTLLLLCAVSPPGARIISLDLPMGRFGGGYPRRKIPLFRQFPRNGQQLSLVPPIRTKRRHGCFPRHPRTQASSRLRSRQILERAETPVPAS